MQKTYDILIVGGGFVGASLALGIQQLGLSCAIIDQKVPLGAVKTEQADNRGLALSATSKKILHQLGVWEALELAATTPIKTVHVSKQGCFGITKLQHDQLGLPALGYLMDADKLAAQLHTQLNTITEDNTRTNVVNKFWPLQAMQFIFNPSQNLWEIMGTMVGTGDSKLPVAVSGKSQAVLSDESPVMLSGKLLVAADGANSTLRALQGINTDTHDYVETALVSNIYINQPHNNIAYERFTAQGTIALLPFGERRMKFVWTVANAQANELLALTDAEFLAAVQQKFGYRLGKFMALDARVRFPLTKVQASTVVGERLLVIGNAANTMHPVAAQGLNLGLRDVAVLIELLAVAQQQNLDIGSNDLLQQYAAARQQDHATTQRLTHRLHALFQGQNFGAKIIQSVCLSACNLLPPLKQWVLRQGVGKLCR